MDSPKDFVALLGAALPEQSAFFMQLLIVSTCVGTLVELFRVTPLLYSIGRAHIGRRLTEKERNQKVEGYVAGSWGPSAAATMLDRDGRRWLPDV